MTTTLVISACDPANVTAEGTCAAVVWIEKPEQVLPPLTLAEGTMIAFAIVSAWTAGLVFRLYARAGQQRQF